MSSRPDSMNPGTAVNRYGESVGRNSRILRDLDAKLSSDNQEEYVEAANKLTKWLVSDKAYYQEVRPQIVTILETAAYTLASLLGLKLVNDFHISRCTADLQPRVEAFTSLVNAVKPFLSLFPEEQLKSRLVNVFAMIYISPPESQNSQESVLARSLSEVSTTVVMKALAASSSRISPVTSLPSSTPATNPGAYSTHREYIADQFTARRPSLSAGQPSPTQNYFAAMSRSTASANPSTSPTTLSPQNMPSSAPVLSTPHAPLSISRAFLLRKAHFPGQDPQFEDAPPIVASMTTQPVQNGSPAVFPAAPSNLYNLQTESTIVPRPPVFSSSTQPIVPVPTQQRVSWPIDTLGVNSPTVPVPTQQHVSRSIDTLGVNSPTTMQRLVDFLTPLSPASFSPSAVVPATIDERRWRHFAQPQGVIQTKVHTEQTKGRVNDRDNNATQAASVAPAAAVLVSYEEGGGRPFSSVESTTDSGTTMSYQPSSIAADDVRSVATSGSMDRVSVRTFQLSQETPTHLPGMARSESVQPMLADKVYSRSPPSSYSQNLEASSQGKRSIGQQGMSPPRDAGHTSKGEMPMLFVQGNPTSPHPPCLEVDLSMKRISEDQTDQGASSEVLGPNSASDVEAGEVERIAMPNDETRRSASVAASPHITDVQTGDRRVGSHVHVNEIAQDQPPLAHTLTSSVEEGTENSATQAPPGVSTSSLSEPSTHGEGPRRASPTSALQTSPTQPDTAHVHPVPIPAIKSGSSGITMEDAHRHASSIVTQNMQERHGKAGKERPDNIDKHLPARPEPRSGAGTAAPELQAGGAKPDHQLPAEEKRDNEHMLGKVEAAHAAQSEGAKDKDGEAGGKAAASERAREKNLPLEKDVNQGGSGKKRPRSLSEEAVSEHPSNKARRDGEERTSLKSKEIVAAESGEPAEKSGDGKEAVGPLTSSAAPPIREERVPEEPDPSGEACDDVENSVSFKAPSEYGSAFHVESLGLPLGSYHPTQPYTTIAIVAGSHMGDTQDVRFELDEEQAMLVKRWTDRFEGLDTPCISITLICTHVPDSQSSSDAEEVGEEDTTQKMIRWPSGGKFWITVEADDRPPVSISVSPPDLIEAHEPLDVSSFVGRGLTTMRFIQMADHAGYRFVLRAHRPTAAQLFALDGAGMAERTFMAGFGAPLPESLRSGLFSSK